MRAARSVVFVAALAVVVSQDALAQTLKYRGSAEASFEVYPQKVANDSKTVVGEALVRFDPTVEFSRLFLLAASFDVRADSHDRVARSVDGIYSDRTLQRPPLAVRRLSALFSAGPVTLEIGKQFVRWGKTDMVNPTDRFTPRDYLIVVDNEVLAVTAARLTVAGPSDNVEFVVAPRLTPSRLPLFTQRWAGFAAATSPLPLRHAGAVFPDKPQYGIRWNHTGRTVEYSFSFFQGFNHQPLFDAAPNPQTATVDVRRWYPAIRTYGTDVLVPLPWFAIRAEAAGFESLDHDTDDYVLYVFQAERQWREWLFIGGYSGEWVNVDRLDFTFAPDRGLAGTILARVSYSADTTRSFVVEAIARHNGEGILGKAEYSRAIGRNWRVAMRFIVIGGSERDFLGQYRLNSFGEPILRFSF